MSDTYRCFGPLGQPYLIPKTHLNKFEAVASPSQGCVSFSHLPNKPVVHFYTSPWVRDTRAEAYGGHVITTCLYNNPSHAAHILETVILEEAALQSLQAGCNSVTCLEIDFDLGRKTCTLSGTAAQLVDLWKEYNTTPTLIYTGENSNA